MTDMLEAQSQISFDDDNELFRQDTDAESEGEDQEDLEDEEDEELVVELGPEPAPEAGIEPDHIPPPPLPLPKGKESILVVHPPKPKPRKPLTLVELPVDVLKEIVKEVGLRHLLSAPLRVRQLSLCLLVVPPPG